MADQDFPFRVEGGAIIAVMGLPYTWRTFMGEWIARWAMCPNLKFEVIRDALTSPVDEGSGGNNPRSDDDDDVAFNIMCQSAASLLDDYRPPDCVVINFPIPTKSQLHTLLRTQQRKGCRLLIIECRRRNKYQWMKYVQKRDGGLEEWNEVEKAIIKHQREGLDDYFLTLAATPNNREYVKKLVVDPWKDLNSRDFDDFWEVLDGESHFAEAVEHLLTCSIHQQTSTVLDYTVWRRQRLEQQAAAASTSRGRGTTTGDERNLYCMPGDCIFNFTNINLQQLEAAVCEACEQNISGAYNYCQICSLSLHELCAQAEAGDHHSTTNTNINQPRSQAIYSYGMKHTDQFLQHYACNSCKKQGKQFSQTCDPCVFTTHLKCQLLPTALKHICDKDHILSMRLSWNFRFRSSQYECNACGLFGYNSSYCCNICNSEYHLDCVVDMPLHTNNQHGGHMHSINIHFSCEEEGEGEYEWCQVCYKDINPQTWVYTCQHCDYVAHLYCIFPRRLLEHYRIEYGEY